jgi:hyperosmotically inducible protein
MGQQMDDDVITARVEGRLARTPDVSATKIDVDTLNSAVTLRGEVESDQERQTAEQVARSTEGVTSVSNQLTIAGETEQPSEGGPFSDAWIQTKLTSKLASDPQVRKRNIDIDVEDGSVTLSGIVESEEAKKRAEQVAKDTEGVQDVKNQLQVESQTPHSQPPKSQPPESQSPQSQPPPESPPPESPQ